MISMKYRVIAMEDLASLESEVNRILEKGGELIGGIGCVRDGGVIIWCQAVLYRY